MRLTTDRLLVIAMIALAGAIGCNNNPAGTGSAGNATSGAAVDSGPSARQAADAFLVALRDRTATPSQLTPAFCAAISPPISDQDKKVGYSTVGVQEWLAQFRDTQFPVIEETRFGNVIVLRGRAEFSTKKEAFALRMVKEGAAYKADWLHHSQYLSMGISSPVDPSLAAAQDTTRNMLDLLLGREVRMAQALMAPEWKKVLSPLASEVKRKDGLEYDPGFLDQNLRALVGTATSYSLTDAKLNSSMDGATFVMEFESEGMKVPHTVKVKKDGSTGWWLIEGFDR